MKHGGALIGVTVAACIAGSVVLFALTASKRGIGVAMVGLLVGSLLCTMGALFYRYIRKKIDARDDKKFREHEAEISRNLRNTDASNQPGPELLPPPPN